MLFGLTVAFVAMCGLVIVAALGYLLDKTADSE
jgi:hypothetical protein